MRSCSIRWWRSSSCDGLRRMQRQRTMDWLRSLRPARGRGWNEHFLLLDTYLLSEKIGDSTQNSETPLRFVARPKLPMWHYSLLGVRPPPPSQSHGVHDCLASQWNQYKCLVQTLLSLLGRLGQSGFAQKNNPTKKKNYTQVVHCASSWHYHPCNYSVVTTVNVPASLQLLWWYHCRCWCTGVSNVVKLALLPSLLVVKRHCCPYCDGVVVLNAQASLPLLQWQLLLLSQWHCCLCWWTGISAIVKLALLPSLLVDKLASSPPLWRCCCHQYTGIFAVIAIAIIPLVMIALLPLSMCNCLCHCQAGVVTCNKGIVTLDLQQCCCPCCNGNVAILKLVLSPYCNGVVVIINVQASSPSLQWCCCPCYNGIVAVDVQPSLPLLQWQLLPSLQWHLCHSWANIVIKLASLPLLYWGCCHHQCAGVFALIKLASLPLLWWWCCRWCAGIFAVQTSLPALW